jgi:hypothetical protein
MCFADYFSWVSRSAKGPVFHSTMSSDEEEARSPLPRASSSKEPRADHESESGSSADELPKKKAKKSYQHLRTQVQWRTVLNFSKGNDSIIGEDEMKLQTS